MSRLVLAFGLMLLGCDEGSPVGPALEARALPTRCWQEFTEHISGTLNIDTGAVSMGVDSVSARMVCEYETVLYRVIPT